MSSEDPDEALGVLIGLLPRLWVPAGPPFRPLADEAADLSQLRYGKICILADADSDGLHIATLLCALFVQHFRPLVFRDEGPGGAFQVTDGAVAVEAHDEEVPLAAGLLQAAHMADVQNVKTAVR